MRALRDYINLEKELEDAKSNLALKPDFNLYDAFRIFDSNSLGYITLSDLKIGLSDIGVFSTYEELELFFNRYDRDRDGKLRFAEFSDAFSP